MHKRYLWVDVRGADIYWPAGANIDVSASGKGTIAFWVKSPAYSYWHPDQYLWRVWIDGSNYVASYGRGVQVKSGGATHRAGTVDNDLAEEERELWELHVATWDFDAGVIKAYYDDAIPAHDPVSGVPAPEGNPVGIYLGPAHYTSFTTAPWQIERMRSVRVYMVGVWNDVMSEAQISALYAEGHRTYLYQEDDGTGNLTFMLTFHADLDADIASGSDDWAQEPVDAEDRFCLLEDGIRELGTATYPLGIPRHDLSDDDRKPLHAVCNLMHFSGSQRSYTFDTNEINYAKLRLEGFDAKRGGAYFPDVPKPGTYRQLIHVPDDTITPAGYEMGIGPIAYKHYPAAGSGVFDWGSGHDFVVVTDGGNSATSFKTDLSDSYADDYWNGALLTLYSGNCAGRSLLVTDWDSASQTITIETAFPATPEDDSVGFVNPYPRIYGQYAHPNYWGNPLPEYCIEAYLWAKHESSKHFVQLDWQVPAGGEPTLRYDKGRTVTMPGCAYPGVGHGANYGMWFWDDGYFDQPGGTNLELWLEKIEIGGPQTYQILRRNARRIGPALADNFMVLTRDSEGAAGNSVKVWEQGNLTLDKQPPPKITDYQAVTADLQAPGTWRDTTSLPTPIQYDEANEVITAAIEGTDGVGTTRLGYIRGHWDDETGRIAWEDETPPPGKSNPVLDVSTLRCERESDSPTTDAWVGNIIQALDGTWSLIYGGASDMADETGMYALHSAPDRWSFDHATQFAGEIVTKGKSIDMHMPLTGHGWMPWGNGHLYGPFFHNPYAQASERAYMALLSAKTIANNAGAYSADDRPMVALAGTDIKSLAPFPYNRELTPLPAQQAHGICGGVLGQEDCIAAVIEYTPGFTAGIGLFTSEDAIHFQELWPTGAGSDAFLPQGELPGEGTRLAPGAIFRLGSRRIYYYGWDDYSNFAWCRYNSETWYRLADNETSGHLVTSMLEKPADGWGELYLNLEPNDGEVEVEVIDPQTEQPLAGYHREDCDAMATGLEQPVTWGSVTLSELDSDCLRLRIYLTRSQGVDESPQLYAWQIQPAEVAYPWASDLLVEGEANPANIVDPTPTFSWTYYDPDGGQQSAYHLLVASSAELLEANTGDLWDSGVVVSAETSVVYQGATLQDRQTYFWKVRVRSSKGVWSEEW